jgi:hypothetical protein
MDVLKGDIALVSSTWKAMDQLVADEGYSLLAASSRKIKGRKSRLEARLDGVEGNSWME